MTIIQTDNALKPQTQEDILNTNFYQELYSRRVYRYDAVSGAQISLKFGDNTLIDDATAIQFSLSQAKKPIYGYHSQYFDTVASGVVIVHGRLFVNFIHQGYLRLLLEHAYDPQFLDKLDSEAKRQAKKANQGSGITHDGLPSSQEAIFEFVKRNAYNRQKQEIVHSQGLKKRPDNFRGTQLQIKYANDKEFNVVPEKILHDVHFIGEGQEIQISGQPIQEMYEFIARRVT